MIESITPYCTDGHSLPEMIGVRCEGEDFEHAYVRKSDLTVALAERDTARAECERYRRALGRVMDALHEAEMTVAL